MGLGNGGTKEKAAEMNKLKDAIAVIIGGAMIIFMVFTLMLAIANS